MSGKIENIHTTLYGILAGITTFNQGFYEQPKAITDEKLPAYAVYLDSIENQTLTSAKNKRTYTYVVEIIYDKENLDTTQTVVSDLVSSVLDAVEATSATKMGGYADFTDPVRVVRVEDYQVAGKHYLAYRVFVPVIAAETV